MQQTVESVFDDLGVGIMLHDPETGRIVGANSRVEELYGYTEAELSGRSVADYSATGDGFTQADIEARIQAAVDGEPQEFEWRIERADGERFWAAVRLAHTTLDGEDYVLTEVSDISARKHHQRVLDSEQAFMKQGLEALEDSFYLLAVDGTLQRWNATLAETLGYSDAELEELHALELFDEADQPTVEAAIAEVRETGSVIVEAAFCTADGELIPDEFTGTQLTDDHGTIQGIIGIGREISDRTERLDRLKTQEEMLRQFNQTVAKSIPFEEKVAELLEFGRGYMGVEQGFLTRINGDSQRIVVGVGPNQQLKTGADAPVSESYCRHTVSPDQAEPLVVTDAASDGWGDDPAYDRFGLGCYVGATITVDGEVTGTLCFADRGPVDAEFTEIQETFVELLAEWASYELERTEREAKYRRLTERISDAYYAVDTDFTVTYWNDTIADRLNVPREDVLNESLWDYFPEITDTVVEDRLREAMTTGEPTTCEYYYEPADYWTVLQIYPDDDGLAVISKDITDRKEYEQRLERSNERLQEFAYILSHDLQEPLRMVSSYIDLLESELGDDLDAETKEYMGFVVDGAERMRGMIDGLLEYSRVETDGKAFEPVDVEAVVDGVVDDLQLATAEADAEIIVGELPTVAADFDQLGQLFQNLLTNAIDHGGDGTTVEVTATETTQGVEFAVSDDGPGIPVDQQDEIFGLFDTGRDSDGTGIGLAVCERIVTRHDGKIRVESPPGEGTTFYITLPDN
ncbi:PAS domain S-box protein [Halonotius pteroides]|nr:PAS domain S-box protein [Halonotius pteroides]